MSYKLINKAYTFDSFAILNQWWTGYFCLVNSRLIVWGHLQVKWLLVYYAQQTTKEKFVLQLFQDSSFYHHTLLLSPNPLHECRSTGLHGHIMHQALENSSSDFRKHWIPVELSSNCLSWFFKVSAAKLLLRIELKKIMQRTFSEDWHQWAICGFSPLMF